MRHFLEQLQFVILSTIVLVGIAAFVIFYTLACIWLLRWFIRMWWGL